MKTKVFCIFFVLGLLMGCATTNHTHKIEHTQTRLEVQLSNWRAHYIEDFISVSDTPVDKVKTMKTGFSVYQTSIKDSKKVRVGNAIFITFYDLNFVCAPDGMIVDTMLKKRMAVVPVRQGR